MTASFVLLAPGLIESVKLARGSGLETPRLASIETCLARANRDRTEHGLYPALKGLVAETSGPLPLPPEAPVCYVGDFGEAPSGWCCRADPVHLEPVGDHLRLLDDSVLQVKLEEAQSLVAAFNTVYEREGLTLTCGAPARWYLTSNTPLDVGHDSPDNVHGHSVLGFMIEGSGGAAGRRLMNEIQMIFHQSEVNRVREDGGKPAINSVWLWGGGRLPLAAPVNMPTAWGDQPCLRGLWSWAGGRAMPLPTSVEPCLSQFGDGLGAAVMDDFLTSLRTAGATAWTGALERLDEYWCRPLLEALTVGRLGDLRLISDGTSFSLRRASLRRWWRRSRPLSDLPG